MLTTREHAIHLAERAHRRSADLAHQVYRPPHIASIYGVGERQIVTLEDGRGCLGLFEIKRDAGDCHAERLGPDAVSALCDEEECPDAMRDFLAELVDPRRAIREEAHRRRVPRSASAPR